ncbi:MAG: TonB-dependent receptor [Pseudomonadota bacterium]
MNTGTNTAKHCFAYSLRALGLGSSFAIATLSAAVSAQGETGGLQVDDAPALEEVLVTARKREEALQDIPMSLSVFGDEEMLRSNFTSLEDYVVRTPNFSFQNNGNRSRSILALRGVSDSNVAATGTVVGFYLDEVSLNPTGGLRQNDMALVDLERIEVLRGPQGTLFGRNTIGGAVNLVSRKPDKEFAARVTAGAERFDTYYLNGFVNLPISERVAVLASGKWEESDGFIDNPALGDSFGNSAEGWRLSLRANPVDDLLVDLAAMNNVTQFDGLQSITEPDFDKGNYESAVNYMPENEVDSELYTLRLEYATSNFDIISLSAWNAFERPEGFDVDGTAQEILIIDVFTRQDSFSQELRLQSNDPDARLVWTLGAFYGDIEDDSVQTLSGGPTDNPGFQSVSMNEAEVENRAVFGEADLLVGDKWTFTLGARYSEDDYTLVNIAGEQFDGSSDAITPKLGLRYQWNDDTLVYFTAARGYKPGGFDTFFEGDEEISTEYDPETAWSYELGVNATLWDGLLAARATLFYMDWEDIQSVFFLDPVNTLVQNAGAAESYGAEFEITAFPVENLTLDLGLGLLSTEYTDFDNTPDGDLTGNELPFAPEVSFSLVADYRLPVGNEYDAFFRGEYNYRSDQEGRNNNNDIERQPGYDLLNLRTGLDSGRYTLTLYAENVLDEEYFTNRRPGIPPAPNTVVPGQPRSYGISFTARW